MILVSLLNIVLSFLSFQSYVVMGTVRNQAGQAVGGIRVSVMDENFQSIRSLFVDHSGHFTVRGLASGRYTFRIETTGTTYEEQIQSLELSSIRLRSGSAETIPLEFVLKLKKSNSAPRSTDLVFIQEVPDAAKAQFGWAISHLKSGESESAIATLKKALELFPAYFDALELLGTEYVKGLQFELGLTTLSKALEVNRNAPKSLYALGVAHLKLNQSNDAIESLKKSIELSPNNPNAPMMLGLAYRQLGDFVQAEAAFKRALQLGGAAMAEAHFYLAAIYERRAKYAEAIHELELYLREGKNTNNPAQIKSLIEKLKEKAKEKPKVSRFWILDFGSELSG